MDVYRLPELVTSQELEQLLRIGRARLSRLRGEDSAFPDPVEHSSPRKPLYRRDEVLRWLVSTGRAPVAALPAFDAPPTGTPVEQRWRRRGTEFVRLPFEERSVEVHVTRYEALEFADSRVVSICVPVGDPGAPAYSGHRLPPSVTAALGYGANGYRGAIAWIAPNHSPGYRVGDLFGADVPDTLVEPVRMRLLDAALVSELLGHLLPYWERGAVSKSAAALWQPCPLGQIPVAVSATHTLPGLAVAAELRRQCRELIDQIDAGHRSAGPGIVDELAQLGNTMWDSTVKSRFHWAYARSPIRLPSGWVAPIEHPPITSADPAPPLPKQPGEVDLYHGLEWLVAQPDLPPAMARTATDFYGFPKSVGVLSVEPARLPPPLAAAIERHLTPVQGDQNWLRDALREELDTRRDTSTAPGDGQFEVSLGWITDPDPDTHPAHARISSGPSGFGDGDLLAYHVPRTVFPLRSEPVAVHLFATTVGLQRRYGGVILDRAGVLSPIPLDPDVDPTTSSMAAQLAATVLGITEPLHLGRLPKLDSAPPQLETLTAALATTDHLEIDWATLAHIVGPRPDGMSDSDLIDTIDHSEDPWPTLSNADSNVIAFPPGRR